MNITGTAKRLFAPIALLSTIGCGAGEDQNELLPGDQKQLFSVNVLSSDKEQISGGNARVEIKYPKAFDSSLMAITLNGEDVKSSLTEDTEAFSFTGVISGLNEGENNLKLHSSNPDAATASLDVTLINHPASGPIFSGPQQQPFYCDSEDMASLGLAAPDDNCMAPTEVSFLYMTTEGVWAEYTPGMTRPADMATTVTTDNKELDFIVRHEKGTLNRFIYSIAILSSASQSLEQPDIESWNKKLLFYFRGGVSIGHKQGSYSSRRALYVEGLKRGYAVAFSTGTATKTHYNLKLAGETALMLKEQFIKKYAVPEYTTAVGQSGGAVQQYAFAENHKGLLDAIIPALSYPDMLTQTHTSADCSLIENWIDSKLMANPDSHWKDWTRRTLVTGFNASNDIGSDLYNFGLTHPNIPKGASECSENWAGLSPLVFNPKYGTAAGVTPEAQESTEWTHFADAINIYGTAADGYANRTWDNVGVQYGLAALTNGDISPDEFLDLNFNAGTLKEEADMVQEGCPYIIEDCYAVDPAKPIWPEQVDIWGARNFLVSDGTNPAPRAKADPQAIENAMAGGLINYGDIQIPTIDVRINLEDYLNMHNTHQSFATRQRMINFDGDASNQSIWFVAPNAEGDYIDPVPHALDVMDDWMANIKANPTKTVADNRPTEALDTCFDAAGDVVASGDDVWNGVIDKTEVAGACTAVHKIFSSTRIVAGASIAGDVLKCDLQPVQTAIDNGLYGAWVPSIEQVGTLNAIYPEGVCKF